MALHITPSSMLKESLRETLEVAKYCADYRKTDEKWGDYKTGGCLGFPAAILLFSLIDTIGSYYRGNKDFEILIDSENSTIEKDAWQHFKILNSEYSNQNLIEEFIKDLYSKFRSYLAHNSVLGKNAVMIQDNASWNEELKGESFFIGVRSSGEKVYVISIKELYELCESAIEKFLKDIDQVVPKSRQGKKFN
jgi:hypothetical protein